jgi:hypothetical protein
MSGFALLYPTYRLTLTLLISDQKIILLDVGSHDEVDR